LSDKTAHYPHRFSVGAAYLYVAASDYEFDGITFLYGLEIFIVDSGEAQHGVFSGYLDSFRPRFVNSPD
jgi:hypothetical protein